MTIKEPALPQTLQGILSLFMAKIFACFSRLKSNLITRIRERFVLGTQKIFLIALVLLAGLVCGVIDPQSAKAQSDPVIPEWDSNNMAETSINSNGSGTYNRILGTFHLLAEGRLFTGYSATQERSGAATVTATDTNADTNPITNLSPNFDGNELVYELPFGTFYVGHIGTCNSDKGNNNYTCFKVAFDVNAGELNNIVRETVTLKLTAMYRFANASIGNTGQVEDTLVVKLHGTGTAISMTLTHGSNSIITYGDANSYPNSRGTIELFRHRNEDLLVNRVERFDSTNFIDTRTSKNGTNSTVGYEADFFRGDYGIWYVATDFSKFEFRPDKDEINGESAGETFSSELIIGFSDGATPSAIGTVRASIKITIEYRGSASMTLTRESGANYTTYTPTGGGGGVTTSFSGALFEDLVGEVEITNAPHPSSINFTASVAESTGLSGDSLGVQNFVINGITYRRIGDNLRYGAWYYVTNGTGKFLFRPNPAGYRTIPKGMEGTSVLTLNLREGSTQRASQTFTVRMTRPADIFLTWDDETHRGMIGSFGGTVTYDDLIGTIDNTHTLTSPSYVVTVSEGSTDQTRTMGMDGTNTTINGLAVETYGTNLTYGTWYFATDRTKVIYRPNSSAINTLQLDMSITTTFNLILNNQSGIKVDEFTTTVTITGQPSVQLTWDSGQEEEVIQSISGKTTYEDVTGRIHFTNLVEHFHLNESESEEILNPIRYPDLINLSLREQNLRQIPEINPTRTLTRYSGTSPANPNPGFSARTIQTPDDNTYGTWFIADDFSKFLFRPNASAINELKHNQQAHAKLIIVLTQTDADGGNEEERARGSIIVALKGLETSIKLTWDRQNVPTIISTGESSGTYEDIIGTIEIENRVPADSDNDLPIGKLKSSNRVRSWEIGPVNSQGVTHEREISSFFTTIQITGTSIFEAEYIGFPTDSLYGRWFIAKDFTKFGFRPNASNINDLEANQSVVVTLRLPVEDPDVARVIQTATISITITGPRSVVDINLDSQDSITINADGSSTYEDVTGTVFINKLTNSRTNVIVTEQKDDEQIKTAVAVQANTAVGYRATPYQTNLTYGVLYFATDEDQFLYRPNSTMINTLESGSSVIVTFRIEIFDVGSTTNPDASGQIVITINGHMRDMNDTNIELELTWESTANDGEIDGGGARDSFKDLRGIVEVNNIQGSHSFKISAVEMYDAKVSNATEGQTNRDAGFTARPLGGLEFGSWYFASNNQFFVFRPNVENIGNLPSGRTITSTLSVIVVDDQTQTETLPVAITVRITTQSENSGEGPFISITASEEEITAGNSIRFRVASTEVIDSNTPINIEFSQAGGSVIWKLPKSFPIASGESEFSFNVLTHNFGFGTNDTVTITATVMDGTGYRVSADYGPAEVTVMKRAVTATSDSRISVAQSAVSAILQAINGNSNSPSQGNLGAIRPTISIHSEQTEIQEGEVALFQLRSSPAPQSTLTIVVAVEETDQISSITNRTVSFASGQDVASLAFQSTNDEIVERVDGTISAVIQAGSDYQIDQSDSEVSIIVSDFEDRERERQQRIFALNESIIPELVESTGERTLDILSSRVSSVFNSNQQVTLRLGGHSKIQDMLTAGGELVNDFSIFRSEILGSSSFSIPISPEEGLVTPMEVWGIGDYRNISGNSNKLNQFWQGDVFAGNVGVDYRFSDELLAGFSIAVVDSQIEFANSDGDEISHITLSQNLQPYIGWNSQDQTTHLYTMIGVGQGEIKVTQEGHESEVLNSSIYSMTVTGKKQLLVGSNLFLPGQSKLDLSGDAWIVNMSVSGNGEFIDDSEFSGSHVQLAMNGSHQFDFANNSSLVPSISVGFRNFEKSKQREYGLEFSNSVAYNHDIGLRISGTNKIFESANNDTQKWELSGKVKYDRNNDNFGEYVNFSPIWGKAENSVSHADATNNFVSNSIGGTNYIDGFQLDTEIGYGVSIFDGKGKLTPYSEINLSKDNGNKYGLGSRFSLRSNLKLDLAWNSNQTVNSVTEQKINVSGKLNW